MYRCVCERGDRGGVRIKRIRFYMRGPARRSDFGLLVYMCVRVREREVALLNDDGMGFGLDAAWRQLGMMSLCVYEREREKIG